MSPAGSSPFNREYLGMRSQLWQLIRRVRSDGCTSLAAMIAYNFFLMLPSVMIFIIATLTFLPVENVGDRLAERFQKEGSGEGSIIQTTLDRTLSEGRVWIFVLSLLGTLYVMNNGYAGLITSLNRIYGLEETRPWLQVRLRALVMSLIAALLILAIFTMTLLTPSIIETFTGSQAITGVTALLINLLRWPLIVGLAFLGLETTYRYAPCGGPRWRYLTPGTIFATGFWLVATRAFGYFVNNYGSYDRVYGALGSVIFSLTWIWISAVTFLIGAEINMMWRERNGT